MEAINHAQGQGLPDGIRAAFKRELRCITGSGAFVDRALAVGQVVNVILGWRFADAITSRQEGDLLREVRKTVEENFGSISEGESRSALDLEEWDRERAAEEEAEAVRVAERFFETNAG